ncbi:MAG: hypothetical protein H6772_01905 [Pseudomonadales bacterium]|nr:hypothetical protein [Pseudomonadales bacterium]
MSNEILNQFDPQAVIARSIQEMGMNAFPLAKFAARFADATVDEQNMKWFREAVRRNLINSDGTMHLDIREQLIKLNAQSSEVGRMQATHAGAVLATPPTFAREVAVEGGLGVMYLDILLRVLEEYGDEGERTEVSGWIREIRSKAEVVDDVPARYQARYDELNKKYATQQMDRAYRIAIGIK